MKSDSFIFFVCCFICKLFENKGVGDIFKSGSINLKSNQKKKLFIIIMKVFILALLVVGILTRSYPMYKQCDPSWANQQLGTSSDTICKAGCLMSSAAMALAGTGHSYNPSTLNTWLKAHGGYVSGDLFVWGSINTLGLVYQGKVANSQIKAKLDQGFVVICNVHNGGHWVLAHSYNGDNINVNDPGFTTTSYTLSQIVDGQNGVYKVGNGRNALLDRFRAAFVNRKILSDADGPKLEEEIIKTD
jgi:hypothetical protein